jgi:hypothetical protein
METLIPLNVLHFRVIFTTFREYRKAFQSIATYLPDDNKIVETNMID